MALRLTDIVVRLRERLARLTARVRTRSLHNDLQAIASRCTALPTLEQRSEDEILGYDYGGLPL